MILSREKLKEFAKDDTGSGLIAFFAVLIVVFSLLALTNDDKKTGESTSGTKGSAQQVSMFQPDTQRSCAGGTLLEKKELEHSGILIELRNFAGTIVGSSVCRA